MMREVLARGQKQRCGISAQQRQDGHQHFIEQNRIGHGCDGDDNGGGKGRGAVDQVISPVSPKHGGIEQGKAHGADPFGNDLIAATAGDFANHKGHDPACGDGTHPCPGSQPGLINGIFQEETDGSNHTDDAGNQNPLGTDLLFQSFANNRLRLCRPRCYGRKRLGCRLRLWFCILLNQDIDCPLLGGYRRCFVLGGRLDCNGFNRLRDRLNRDRLDWLGG